MGLKEALGERRLHDQLMPDVTTFERGFDGGVVEGMESRGHEWVWVEAGGSAVQGVLRRGDGGFEAASELRQRDSGGVSC